MNINNLETIDSNKHESKVVILQESDNSDAIHDSSLSQNQKNSKSSNISSGIVSFYSIGFFIYYEF